MIVPPKSDVYEVVQEHVYQDIYRIQYGTLLIVNKFVYPDRSWISESLYKKKVSKVQGIAKCFITKEDLTDPYDKIIYPAGTIILNGSIIIPTRDNKKYWIELKMSGGAFAGSIKEYDDFKKKIDEVLLKYR